MKTDSPIANYIVGWLNSYIENSGLSGFIVGISGGVDSALTSTLCALTGKKTIILTLPIRQHSAEYNRALNHIEDLKKKFPNVEALEINLTGTFTRFEEDLPKNVSANFLAMANSRARLRMATLYAVGQQNGCIVAGTGNKVEDFGVGFYTKYGDGGVDISPIADLYKTQVWQIAKEIGVIEEIVTAPPTDGLWADGRSDEDQIGASYPELEWAMENLNATTDSFSDRQKEVITLYKRLHKANLHKMNPIPVCNIPSELSLINKK